MQAEFLEDLLGIASELFVLLVRLLGLGELHQLNLLELVLADDAAHVLAMRAGFAAEAWSIGSERDGQPRTVERLITIEVSDWHLGGGNQIKISIVKRNLEKVGLELGKLSGSVHRLGVDHEGRQNFGVAV